MDTAIMHFYAGHIPSRGRCLRVRYTGPTLFERDKMKILVAIVLTSEQKEKIGWAMGNYSDEPIDEIECRDWINASLLDTIDALPNPPA